jgi:hypothetical protein
MAHISNDPVFSKDEYQSKLLLHNRKFQEGVLRLRRKWGIPDEGFTLQRTYDDWLSRTHASGEYQGDVRELSDQLSLTARWHQAISQYTQMNAPLVLKLPPHNPIKVTYGVGGKIDSIVLQVDKDSTQREIIEAFKEAKYMLGEPEDKKQQPDPEKLDRDIEVFERHLEGEKNTEIANWLNRAYDEAYTTEDVKRILKRIKRKLT